MAVGHSSRPALSWSTLFRADRLVHIVVGLCPVTATSNPKVKGSGETGVIALYRPA